MIRVRREAPAAPPDPAAVETVLGRGTEFKGDLKSSASVRVDGRLEGSLQTSGDLIVGESGVLVANVEAASIMVAGEVQGQVKASARLEIAPTGRIRGDVETPVLVINEGGRLDGRCAMPAPDRAPAMDRHRRPSPDGSPQGVS